MTEDEITTDEPGATDHLDGDPTADTEEIATAEAVEGDPEEASAKAGKPSKAERLEAKAARLREAAAARAEAAATPRPPASHGLAITFAIISLVLLVLLGLSVGYALHERSKANSAATLAATRVSATRAATEIATDFGSYNYTTLKADLARTESHLTPSLAKSFSQVSASLEATIVANRGKNVAKVQGVAISSVHGGTAVALVFLDQTVTSSTSSTARIDRNRLEMTLVRQKNGSWLASKIGVI